MEDLYELQCCARCVLEERVRVLLSSDGHYIEPHLQPLFDVLVSAETPRSTLRWLRRGAAATLLRDLLIQGALSHDALDRVPTHHARDFLRSILVAAGILPTRSEASNRIERWLLRFSSSLPESHSKIVRLYAQWHLLRRMRRKLERGAVTAAGIGWFQQRVRVAAQFLQWLTTHHLSIETCAQPDVERWLADSHVTTAYSIRDFLRWTSARRISSRLDVPSRSRRSIVDAIDDDHRWAQIRMLLHNEALGIDLRVAGLLLLVFAQQLSRVCALQTTSIAARDNDVFLNFGGDDVLLPAAVAQLVLRLAENARNNRKSIYGQARWLFPGKRFGSHVDPRSVGKRLAHIGIDSRSQRRGSIMHLASRIDPAILASLLNLHPNTAVQWSRNAGRVFAPHVARHLRSAKERVAEL